MATHSNSSVILDSSALVAMFKTDDADHAKSVKIDASNTKHGRSVLLPYEVVAETLNIIGKKINRTAAVEAGGTILIWHASGEVILTTSDTQTLGLAVELQAAASGGPSFVDCLVMAHADQQQTSLVFGFDATFKKNGYQLPGK